MVDSELHLGQLAWFLLGGGGVGVGDSSSLRGNGEGGRGMGTHTLMDKSSWKWTSNTKTLHCTQGRDFHSHGWCLHEAIDQVDDIKNRRKIKKNKKNVFLCLRRND